MLLDTHEYFEKHCPYVTEQIKNESLDLLSSLMQYNLVAKLEEQNVLNQDLKAREKKRVSSKTKNNKNMNS